MTPFVKLREELEMYSKDKLIEHIEGLYEYIEEIKYNLRLRSVEV